MDDLLTQFLQESDPATVNDCATRLSSRNNPADLPFLLAALRDPLEARRQGAAYALGLSQDERSPVVPLIHVLLDPNESIRVRAEAAEALGRLGQRRAIKPLIRCTRHPSPELRFWSVFALGQITCFRRKQLTRAGIRALEARLNDLQLPDSHGYWPIRYEALSMLNGLSPKWSQLFQSELNRVLADPITHASLWQWAAHHTSPDEMDYAARTITAAGLDPVTHGHSPTATSTPPPN